MTRRQYDKNGKHWYLRFDDDNKISYKLFQEKLTDFCHSALITVMSLWARWRLKSPASRLFTQPFNQTQIKENIKAPRHWPLGGEFTGHRWILRTKGQLRLKCFHLMTSSWRRLYRGTGTARIGRGVIILDYQFGIIWSNILKEP